MTEILLTNDDGYKSIGFYPLLKELSKQFNVIPIAPKSNRSWISKALSKRVTIQETKLHSRKIYTCSGTSADCVQIGLYHLLQKKPKVVISGINIGANVGHARILSSGTVGAGMEACIDGIKSVCISLHIPPEIRKKQNFMQEKNYTLFENAGKIALKIINILLYKNGNDSFEIININIPYDATIKSKYEITKPFHTPYGKLFHKKGNSFSLISPSYEHKNLKVGTDLHALQKGKISITPLNLHLTFPDSIKPLDEIMRKEW